MREKCIFIEEKKKNPKKIVFLDVPRRTFQFSIISCDFGLCVLKPPVLEHTVLKRIDT